MKNIFIMMIAAAMVVSMAGCGKSATENSSDNTDKTTQVTQTAAPDKTTSADVSTAPKESAGTDAKSNDASGSEQNSENTKTDENKPRETAEFDTAIESYGKLEKVEPLENKEINSKCVEKDFSGTWIATATTSENDELENVTLTITYTDYTVDMDFMEGTQETAGKYKIKDGVLKFDSSMDDCTAYFYNDNKNVLVLDNGNSILYCTQAEEVDE